MIMQRIRGVECSIRQYSCGPTAIIQFGLSKEQNRQVQSETQDRWSGPESGIVCRAPPCICESGRDAELPALIVVCGRFGASLIMNKVTKSVSCLKK